MRFDRKQLRSLIILVAVLLLFGVGFIVAGRLESESQQAIVTDPQEQYGEMPRITWQGETYRKKAGIHTILVIGYDKESTDERVGFRDGGQSDFLLLLVINDHDRTVLPLEIDRDTMTRISTIGLSGRPAGTAVMQICLAHAYGDSVEINDQFTCQAVEGFLPGVTVDYSISLGFDFISRFNDLIGGVTLTLEDDLSDRDPAMTAGATLTLTGSQALLYCRARMSTGDGRNTSRMRRQRAYIEAASKTLLRRVKQDGGFASTMVNSVFDITHCTLSRGALINEIDRAATFTILDQYTLPGEHAIGKYGYMECTVKEEDVMAWVLDTFYIKE